MFHASQRFPAAAAGVERMLCLHCSASSGRQWSSFADLVAGRYAVVAPDLIGYGTDDDWPAERELSLDVEVDRLLARIGPSGPPMHVFGHSYGGAVALQLAMQRPARVKSLTLYEPVRFALLRGPAGTAAASREVETLGRRVRDDAITDPRGAAARFVDYWSGIGAWAATSPARQAALALRMAKVGREFEALLSDRVGAADYRALSMPVRLVGGDRSPRPVLHILDRLARLLPQAECVVLPRLGHMGPVQAPGRLAALFEPGKTARARPHDDRLAA